MAFSKSMVNPCFVIFLTRSTQSSLRFLFFLCALCGSFSDLEKTMPYASAPLGWNSDWGLYSTRIKMIQPAMATNPKLEWTNPSGRREIQVRAISNPKTMTDGYCQKPQKFR